jgi:hypothetical protein
MNYKRDMEILKNIQEDLARIGWHSSRVSFSHRGNLYIDLSSDKFINVNLKAELTVKETPKEKTSK